MPSFTAARAVAEKDIAATPKVRAAARARGVIIGIGSFGYWGAFWHAMDYAVASTAAIARACSAGLSTCTAATGTPAPSKNGVRR